MNADTKRCGRTATAAERVVKARAFFSITRLHINISRGTLHPNKDMSNDTKVRLKVWAELGRWQGHRAAMSLPKRPTLLIARQTAPILAFLLLYGFN